MFSKVQDVCTTFKYVVIMMIPRIIEGAIVFICWRYSKFEMNLIQLMLVTDFGDELCWWQVWDFSSVVVAEIPYLSNQLAVASEILPTCFKNVINIAVAQLWFTKVFSYAFGSDMAVIEAVNQTPGLRLLNQ